MNVVNGFLGNAGPSRIARFVDLAMDREETWSEADLACALVEQFSRELQEDFDRYLPGEMPQSFGEGAMTFEALLCSASPSVETLDRCKRLAQALARSDAAFPRSAAKVLYFATLAAAKSRCHTQISSLSEDETAAGYAWVLRQRWVSGRIKSLIRQVHPTEKR